MLLLCGCLRLNTKPGTCTFMRLTIWEIPLLTFLIEEWNHRSDVKDCSYSGGSHLTSSWKQVLCLRSVVGSHWDRMLFTECAFTLYPSCDIHPRQDLKPVLQVRTDFSISRRTPSVPILTSMHTIWPASRQTLYFSISLFCWGKVIGLQLSFILWQVSARLLPVSHLPQSGKFICLDFWKVAETKNRKCLIASGLCLLQLILEGMAESHPWRSRVIVRSCSNTWNLRVYKPEFKVTWIFRCQGEWA